ARTLTRLKEQGATEFYLGETATLITRCMSQQGGVMQASDLIEYSPVVREPLRGDYKGYEVISMPPPSSGGAHLIQMLNLLEPLPLTFLEAGSSESYHLIAEAMCLAFADRAEYLGDPAFTDVPIDGLISKQYADSLRKKISRLSHQRDTKAGEPRKFEQEHHTTHLCVVDAEGNAVSLTATINTPFGTGITVPGAGILLNNEMDDFVTNPGKPNFFGLVGKPVNEVEAGKRPLSSMTPTIVVKDDKPYLLAGGAGGPKIITATLLTILNALDFHMNIQLAVDFPRIHQQWTPDKLICEKEVVVDVREALQAKGHLVEAGPYGSYVQAILADTLKGGWWGAADGRSNGQAKGF
ncbi:gamma-glutamyltransferase, partial [bacterium]|nr:gamma-glutamyltransferase [bacterium]